MSSRDKETVVVALILMGLFFILGLVVGSLWLPSCRGWSLHTDYSAMQPMNDGPENRKPYWRTTYIGPGSHE